MARYLALITLVHGQYSYSITADGKPRRGPTWIPQNVTTREKAAAWVHKVEGEHVQVRFAEE